MNFEKDNMDNYNSDDDLNFIPLNIEPSLSPNSTKFPLSYNMDGISISQNYGAISLGFPNLNINPNPMPLNVNNTNEMTPLTPYPKNIPNIYSTNDNINSKIYDNNNNNNNNNNNMFNTNSKSIELEYPTELNDDFLYSYNEPEVNERHSENLINALDILRSFDFSIDYSESEFRKDNYTENEINDILSLIEKDNVGILATMKAYRIPYPIAKLLIKKIIKISLDNCKR